MSSAYFPHFFYVLRLPQQTAKCEANGTQKQREKERNRVRIHFHNSVNDNATTHSLCVSRPKWTISSNLTSNIWVISIEFICQSSRSHCVAIHNIHSFIQQQREREANTFAQMVSHLIGECVWVVFPTVTHSHHMTRPTANSIRSQYTEYYHILRASVSVFECDVCDSSGEANLSNVCIVVVLVESLSSPKTTKK